MALVDAYATLYGELDRRVPGSDDMSRRIARLSNVGPGARVLNLGCGPGRTARLLAREYGCSVVCVDEDPAAIELLRQRSPGDGVAARIEPRLEPIRSLSFAERSFDAVVAEGLTWSIGDAAPALRRVLAERGRLTVTAPCRVGRTIPQGVADFWSRRLGEPLRFPGELLVALAGAGFEPLACEALPEALLDEHYRALEPGLSRVTGPDGETVATEVRREIDIFRREGGRTAVSLALLVARRKEPGEKPPPARGGSA